MIDQATSRSPIAQEPAQSNATARPANDDLPVVLIRKILPAASRAKRATDLITAAVLLLFLATLLCAVALLIRLEDGGPAIFRQRRTGLNGSGFRIFKFRTMRVCEDGECIAQATRGDQRVTRVGRWLRATSIDELPQLLNVLRGEMSLVGPRPHALVHDQGFRTFLPRYDDRFQTRPGITGLAQIRGLRGEIRSNQCIAHRVASDIEYLENWTLWLDLRILAQSAAIIFKREAY